jgi:aspartyl-tRNA synthetase
MCALVVLAQLSADHGVQIKWALEFPGSPLGAIEYILLHVIEKMGKAGLRSATFGAGAASELRRVANIGGFKVVTLEKAYNGISHTFHLGRKGDFRSKFGVRQDPVCLFLPF